ncbi:MAG: PBP1A family penicillin-binding protein [Candidatus Coatesbacteria bacterium]|nr:PBP1A family penicillin-binding protein [Candidatus Coatesbacteria bacterium]
MKTDRGGRPGRVLVLCLWLLLILAVAFVVAGLLVYRRLASDLPSIEMLNDFRPSLASLVYDGEGNKVHEFYIERRIWTPIEEIPEMMQKAIVAVEDSRFYSHGGVDWFGLIRAAWANLRHRRYEQGASTITQQLARRLFLTPEKTVRRKLREIILAYKIEAMLSSKQKILEYYLNEIYLGSGAYGVQAAAQLYFGRPLNELSVDQFALIAGLLRAPSRYSPLNNRDLALKRRNHALRRMAAEKFVSQEECAEAIKRPLGIAEEDDPSGRTVGAWFYEHIRRSALEIFRGPSYKEMDSESQLYSASASDVVYRNGLNLYSTLDLRLQAAAERAVESGLRELDKRQGFRGPMEEGQLDDELTADKLQPGLIAVGKVSGISEDEVTVSFGKDLTGVIKKRYFRWALDEDGKLPLATESLVEVKIDPKFEPGKDEAVPLRLEQRPIVEGALVAIDLHTGYVKAMAGGRSFATSEFNRAVQSRRQPGSAFKPIIYTAAIDCGMVPTDIILDVPVYIDEIDKVWKPENYGQRVFGPITLQTALEKSKNLATINLIRRIDPRLAVKYARILGIESHLEAVPSLALGSIGVSLLDLTCLYGVIATEGERFKPIFIKQITDHSGRELYRQESSFEQVISPQTAYVMIHMMQGVIQRGTGVRAKSLGHNLAGKTGTTNDYIDAWFVGFSPDLVVGAWVGFDELEPLGSGETGARAALPIWKDFMETALEGEPEKEFPVPEGIVFRMIDAETGLLASEETTDTIKQAFIAGTEPVETERPTRRKTRRFDQIDAGL